jgi:hypothetical protein
MNDTQKAYETIRAWLARPGATQCTGGANRCVYLSLDADEEPNGCALGGRMLITGDLPYSSCYEGRSIESLYSVFDEIEEFWGTDVDVNFLCMAQNAHDHDETYTDWQADALTALDEAAREFGLEVIS